MGKPQEDRVGGSKVMDTFGELVWEAAKKFHFIKLQATESILNRTNITMMFAVSWHGNITSHTEMFTTETLTEINDPKVIVNAIYDRLMREAKSKV